MYSIRPMTMDDLPDVATLLVVTSGVVLRDADTPEGMRRYLQRNPEYSFDAEVADRIVGCAMSGHDGRRGYLNHVCVTPEQRSRGIAAALVEQCLGALARNGITKVHLDVLENNANAKVYWPKRGWQHRLDIQRFSMTLSGGENA